MPSVPSLPPAGRPMTAGQALAFVRRHGVVLESARGPVPCLAEAIAGEPIRGSWWAHPSAQRIFEATRAVRDSPQVLVCRAVQGKITLVHERRWAALVRLAPRLRRAWLARLREVHTASGRHAVRSQAFPGWVPARVLTAAERLGEAQARRALGSWLA